MSDHSPPDRDPVAPELALEPQPSEIQPETTDPNQVAPGEPALAAQQAQPAEALTAAPPMPAAPADPAAPAAPQRTSSAVAPIPIPPPPPAPTQYTGPEIYQRLSVLFVEVLPRVGLEKLLNTMAVYVKTCERELFVEGEIRLDVFHRPLDQNHIPQELIGRVLGQMVLYCRRFIQAPFALPSAIQEDAVQAIAAIPDPEALLTELYDLVETRLSAQGIEARRQAALHAEAVEAARATRKLTAQPRRREPLFGNVTRTSLLRGVLAGLLFIATAGYWINFALNQLHKEAIDPRAHLAYLDPENFAPVLQIEKARVSMGTLFIVVPPGKLPGMSKEERESIARRLLEIIHRPDVNNVNLRDESIQVHITVRH